MIYIIPILIYLFVLCITFFLAGFIKKERIHVLLRLDRIKVLAPKKSELSELDTPFKQRILIPFLKAINKTVSRITPKVMKSRIEQYLKMAGKPVNPYAAIWLLVKIILGFFIPSGILTYLYLNNKLFNMMNVLILLIVSVFLFYFPEIYLLQSANQRKKEIERTLPDVLDLLTVSVEAGLSFDNSINKLTEKMSGAISDEFKRTLHEIRIGKTRKEAMQNMSKRCNVSDLSVFITSLVQADELGIGISNVLRVQSAQMREKRRQRAQEKAMKAPVKILFPLIFFIFPTIFVIILGPSIIKFTELMGK